MKKCGLMLVLILLSSSIFAQFGKKEGGKIAVKEIDGSPAATEIDTIEVNNGSLTVSGNVATINITAAAASSADSVGRDDGMIDGDSLMTKTRTDTVTGTKVFLGDVILPDNCITSDQISTNAVGSLEIAGSAVKESEINWAEVTADSIASILGSKIDSTHIKANSVHESEMNWGKQNADSAFSAVSAKVRTAISDSLGKGRFSYSISIDSTRITTAAKIPFFYTEQAITIDTVIVNQVSAGSPSIVPQIYHDDSLSVTGALVLNSPGAATSKTTGTRYTSFTDNTLDIKEWAWIKFTTVTTAPTVAIITVVGRKK